MYSLYLVDDTGVSYSIDNINYRTYTDACIAVEEFEKALGADCRFIIEESDA